MPLNGIRTATETSSMNGNDGKARALKVATSKYTPSQKKNMVVDEWLHSLHLYECCWGEQSALSNVFVAIVSGTS